MASVLTTVTQKIAVSDVADIKVTEIVSADGVYTRAIRIYGAPSGTDAPPVLEIVVSSDTQGNIKLTTPEIEY